MGTVIYEDKEGIVVPIETYQKTHEVNCQFASQIKSEPGVELEGGIVVPYAPKCRPDRPELFEARQCTEHDCFCVNVTTGTVLIGTHASPSEVGDCSAAIYSIRLTIRSPIHNASNDYPSFNHPSTSHLDDTIMRTKILYGLEQLLQSVAGYQQVVNITQLIMVPKHPSMHATNLGHISYYQAELISVGHSSVQGPLDLIQHRLEEGHLPIIGTVDRDLSRVTLLKDKIKDPFNVGSKTPEYAEPEVKNAVKPLDSIEQSKSIFPRSYEINSFAPTSLRSPGATVERESRQLPIPADGDTQILGGIVAPSFTEGPSTLHQTWQVQTSRLNILRQPGVIAGIVGSAVAGLLLLILLILFCIYRLRKKDEGSYALDEPKKRPPVVNAYQRAPTREFYA